MLKETLIAAIEEMIGDMLDGDEFFQAIAARSNIDLTPYKDDGETEADTYRICTYFDNSDRCLPSVRLLDLIHSQFDDTLAHYDSIARDGYDKALEGFAVELAECLAIVERVLQAERIKGIRNGDWSGSVSP